MSNFDEVNILIKERNIDILCISETWLLQHTPDASIRIPNYKIYRCDNGRGSGVCMYVNDLLQSHIIDTNITKIRGIEDICVQIQLRKLPSFIIGCIYRHPKAPTNAWDYITDLFRSVLLRKKTMYVLGDLNDDILSRKCQLSRIVTNNKLTQVIDKPTRITPTSATLLDVIITNNPDTIIKSEVSPQAIADHDLVGNHD